MVETRDKRIIRMSPEDINFIPNMKFPGAFCTSASFPYLQYDSKGIGCPSDMDFSEVLKLSPRFSKIGIDYENNVFCLGNDAIIGVYDLNGIARSEIPKAKSEILTDEIDRLRKLNRDSFYSKSVDIAIVEYDFPMMYADGGIIHSSSHIVVVKDYKRCLSTPFEETGIFEVTSISKPAENPIQKFNGRAKKKRSLFDKIFKR